MISTTSLCILAAIIIIIIAVSVYYYNNNDKQKDKFDSGCDNNRMYSMQTATDNLDNAAKGINNNMRIFNSAYDIILLNGTKYDDMMVTPLDRLKYIRRYLNKLEDFTTSVNNTITSKGEIKYDDAIKLYDKYKKYEYNNYKYMYTGSNRLNTRNPTPTAEINDIIIKTAHYISGLGEVGKPLSKIAKSLYNLGSINIDNFSHSISYLGCTLRKIIPV